MLGANALTQPKVDLLIITALYDELVQLKAVDKHAISDWIPHKDAFGFEYYQRQYEGTYGVLRVAAASATDMGGQAVLNAAVNLVSELRPKCIGMSGICAGRRGDCALGDLIVANKVFRYDQGKVKTSINAGEASPAAFFHELTTYGIREQWKQALEPIIRAWQPSQPKPISLVGQALWVLNRLLEGPITFEQIGSLAAVGDWEKVNAYLRKHDYVHVDHGQLVLTDTGRNFIQTYRMAQGPGFLDEPSFQVHLAPIASGEAVIADDRVFAANILKLVRKTLGLEMEAAALGALAHRVETPFLVVKGVADHTDADKDDSFHPFAVRASAELLLDFMCQHLQPVTMPERPILDEPYYPAPAINPATLLTAKFGIVPFYKPAMVRIWQPQVAVFPARNASK